MSERLQDEETEIDPDEFGLSGLDDADEAASTADDAASGRETDDGGRFSRFVPSVGIGRLGRLRPEFAPRRFALAVGLFAVGIVGGGMIPLVGTVTQYVGLFAAAFLLGVVDRAGYLEAGAAGAVAAGFSVVASLLSTGGFVIGFDLVRRYGVAVAGVGVGVGLLLAVVGLYFGRDLRAGLTRSV